MYRQLDERMPCALAVDFNRGLKLRKSMPPFVNTESEIAGRNANILSSRRSRTRMPVQFCDVIWRRSSTASAVALPGIPAGATERRKIAARSRPYRYRKFALLVVFTNDPMEIWEPGNAKYLCDLKAMK